MNATDHGELYVKYKSFLGIDNHDSSVSQLLARDSAQNGVLSSGHGLFCPAEAIVRGSSTQFEDSILEVAVFENPAECADDRKRQHGAESILKDELRESMKKHLRPFEDTVSESLYNMNPLIKNIPEIYRPSDSSDAPDGSTSSIVFFGLQLFVDSYKSFLLCDESTSKT